MAQDYRAPPLRKLFGSLAMLVLVVVYALAIMVVLMGVRINEMSAWLQLAIYAIMGFAWVLPAMVIIKWMEKPKNKPKG